jgi:hypothetical protein
MKYLIIICVVASSLGGCAVVPVGYGDRRDGYDQEHYYGHGYGDHSYGRSYDDRGGPFHYEGS